MQYREHLEADVSALRESESPFYTPESLAEYLRVSERTVRGMLAAGTMPSYKVGGSRRIHAEDVQRYLSSRRQQKAS